MAISAQEAYGLTAQLRRAAVSVPASIAERLNRRSRLDEARRMNIAERSREGARDYLRLAENVGYGADNALRTDALEVRRLLRSDARTLLASSS